MTQLLRDAPPLVIVARREGKKSNGLEEGKAGLGAECGGQAASTTWRWSSPTVAPG
jgi:hypothetical protein